MSRLYKARIFITAACLTAVLAYVTCLWIADQQNTLLNNAHWAPYRATQIYPLRKDFQFLATRAPLTSERLHLHFGRAYHEILNANPINPKSISADIFLDSHNFSDLVLRTRQNVEGFRFSTQPRVSGFYFVADASGKFIHKTPIPFLRHDKGWKHFEINFTKDHSLEIRFDNQSRKISRKTKHKNKVAVGFRGSGWVSILDNITLEAQTGTVLTETFSRKNSVAVFLISWLCFLAIALSAMKFTPNKLLTAASLGLMFLLLLSAAYTQLHYYTSVYQTSEGHIWRRMQHRYEGSAAELVMNSIKNANDDSERNQRFEALSRFLSHRKRKNHSPRWKYFLSDGDHSQFCNSKLEKCLKKHPLQKKKIWLLIVDNKELVLGAKEPEENFASKLARTHKNRSVILCSIDQCNLPIALKITQIDFVFTRIPNWNKLNKALSKLPSQAKVRASLIHTGSETHVIRNTDPARISRRRFSKMQIPYLDLKSGEWQKDGFVFNGVGVLTDFGQSRLSSALNTEEKLESKNKNSNRP